MATTLQDMLYPQVVLDVTSRIRKGQGLLGKMFGFHYGDFSPEKGVLAGPNTKESPTRSGTYRQFDHTRTVANFRAPGTGPAWTPPNPVGQANYTCARVHEKVRLDYESLSALSPIVGPNSQVDTMGQDYIVRQKGYLAERFNNAIELMTAGMIRGTWYLQISGESLIPSLSIPSGNYLTVSHQIPAGNFNQLNMLGTGNIIDLTWANPAAKIISKHLPNIAIAFQRLHGYQLKTVVVDPTIWGYVVNNTEVINTAGSANTPFERFEYAPEKGSDGKSMNRWVAVLRGYPTVEWHIVTDVIVDNAGTDPSYAQGTGTLVPVLPANTALFLPEISPDWVDLVHFGEPVVDNPGMPAVKRPGFYMWSEYITQPSAIEILGLMNCIPRVIVPKIPTLGTVVY